MGTPKEDIKEIAPEEHLRKSAKFKYDFGHSERSAREPSDPHTKLKHQGKGLSNILDLFEGEGDERDQKPDPLLVVDSINSPMQSINVERRNPNGRRMLRNFFVRSKFQPKI